MLRTATFVIAVSLLLPAGARAADDTLPSLLTKLAADEDRTAKVYDDWDYSMTIHAEELDRKGSTSSDEKIEMRHAHVNGESTDDLVRYERDGKDVTAEEQAKHKAKVEKREAKRKDSAKKDDDQDFPSPFATKEQAKYTFTRLGPDPADASRVRIGFVPKKAAEMEMKGEASVDAATGRIRSITMTPAKMPAMVQQLAIEMEYQSGPDDLRLLSVLKIHGEAGILFVKKRFRATTTFKDFAKPGATK